MANNAPVKYGTSPVGRLIMGDPFNKQTKDQNQRDIPLDKQKFFFGIAVEKNAPGVNEMIGTMQQAAMEGYANNPHVMQQIQAGLNAPAFSWKIQDGDEMKVDPATGQQVLRSPHGAGCYIFKFSTTIPIQSAKFPPGSNVPTFCDPSEIVRGYFVQVSYSTQANGNQDNTAGIYLNPKTICLVGFGEPIVSGPSLEQQFAGGTGGYVPAGMSQTPQAPMGAPGAMPQAGTPMPGQMPQAGTPMPGQMPQAGTPMPGQMPQAGTPMGNGFGGQPQNPAGTGMPSPNAGAGMPNAGNPASPTPAMESPSNPMPQPGNPMQSGMPQPANNGQNGQTSSPGNGMPPQYGGYMNPPS